MEYEVQRLHTLHYQRFFILSSSSLAYSWTWISSVFNVWQVVWVISHVWHPWVLEADKIPNQPSNSLQQRKVSLNHSIMSHLHIQGATKGSLLLTITLLYYSSDNFGTTSDRFLKLYTQVEFLETSHMDRGWFVWQIFGCQGKWLTKRSNVTLDLKEVLVSCLDVLSPS